MLIMTLGELKEIVNDLPNDAIIGYISIQLNGEETFIPISSEKIKYIPKGKRLVLFEKLF